MNPQSWLDAFVLRNLTDLARLRGYLDSALATSIEKQRGRRPRPERIPGEVLAMEVRDLVLLLADNPVFNAGSFTLLAKRNRGIRLQERSTGTEISVRKVAEDGAAMSAASEQVALKVEYFQDSLLPEVGPSLSTDLSAMVVWAVGADDLLADYRAIIIDRPDGPVDLNRVTMRAAKEIPPLEAITGTTLPGGAVVTPGDDFGDLVKRKGVAEETGDTPPGV